jgi:hypothetical protein
VEYWRILLFKDWYNYGGIKEGTGDKKVVAKWDIALHLPESIQRKFLLTVSEYILKVFRYNQKLLHNQEAGIPMEEDLIDGGAGDEKVVSYMDAVEDYKKGKDHNYIVKLISEFFSQKLFSLIHEIFVRKEDKDQEA